MLRLHSSLRWAALLPLVVLLVSNLAVVQSVNMDYCSSVNTGSGPGNHSDFQSDGLCIGFCTKSSNALAIVQGNLCWCSDTLPGPSIQVSIGNCKDPCPGFPDDFCGGDSTWGYIRIKANPIKSTAGSGASSPSPTQSSQGSEQTVAPQSPQSPQSPESSQPPQVATVTADGSTKIVTVLPTEPVNSSPSNSGSGSEQGGGGLQSGAVAGIVVGVLAILISGAVIGFLYARRKKRSDQEAQEASRTANFGAMQGGSTGFATRRPTNGTWTSDHSSGRRSSMPDPRMKSTPGTYQGLVSRSRESLDSIQDNHDYSRPIHEPKKVLKVMNANLDDMDD